VEPLVGIPAGGSAVSRGVVGRGPGASSRLQAGFITVNQPAGSSRRTSRVQR